MGYYFFSNILYSFGVACLKNDAVFLIFFFEEEVFFKTYGVCIESFLFFRFFIEIQLMAPIAIVCHLTI